MAIGTPALVGSADDNSGGTSVVVTVGAAGVPAGALIVVIWGGEEAGTEVVCADSAANTYVRELQDINHASADTQMAFFYAVNVTALVENDTITVSWASTTESSCIIGYVTGIRTSMAVDQSAVTEVAGDALDTGNITTTSDTIIFGAYGGDLSGVRTPTEDSEFTNLGGEETPPGRQTRLSYKVSSSSETINWAPTGYNSVDFMHAVIISFSGLSGVGLASETDSAFSVTPSLTSVTIVNVDMGGIARGSSRGIMRGLN